MKVRINENHWQIKFLEEVFKERLFDLGEIETTQEDVDMAEHIIDEAMMDLSPRQKEVIVRRLMKSPPDDLETIGVDISMGNKTGNSAREYARLIEELALRSLRHPSRYHKLLKIFKELKEYRIYNILELNVEFKKEELRDAEQMLEAVRHPEKIGPGTPIDALGLSLRVYNCLKRSGCKTVGQLVQISKDIDNGDIKIRNFGRKSLSEIKEKIADFYDPV